MLRDCLPPADGSQHKFARTYEEMARQRGGFARINADEVAKELKQPHNTTRQYLKKTRDMLLIADWVFIKNGEQALDHDVLTTIPGYEPPVLEEPLPLSASAFTEEQLQALARELINTRPEIFADFARKSS